MSQTLRGADIVARSLARLGCKRVFTDVAGGAGAERPGLAKALEYVRRGDTLVVWKLDRFGRSLRDLVESINALKQRKVGFRSCARGARHVDERRPSRVPRLRRPRRLCGEPHYAEFERSLIVKRTRLGLPKARREGTRLGRPRVERAPHAEVMRRKRAGETWEAIAKALRCSVWAARSSARMPAKKGGTKRVEILDGSPRWCDLRERDLFRRRGRRGFEPSSVRSRRCARRGSKHPSA